MENFFEEIMLKNKKCYFSTTVSLCNTQKHHGLLVSKINNQFVKIISNLLESLVVFDNVYELSFRKYSKVFDTDSNSFQNTPRIDNSSFKTCFTMGPILLEKTIHVDKFDNKITIIYHLKETCSDVLLKIKPLFAFTNIFYCSRKRNIRNLKITDNDNSINIQTSENKINLDIFINKEYSLEIGNDWVTNVEFSESFSKYYEDLYMPLDLTIPVSRNEKIIMEYRLDTNQIFQETLEKEYLNSFVY